MPSATATAAVVSWVAAKPAAPVQALAHPLLTRKARALPWATRSAETTTGAARTRLVVNTAAAGTASSATARARSGLPFDLMPAQTPEKANPGTTVVVCSVRTVTLTSLLLGRPVGGSGAVGT